MKNWTEMGAGDFAGTGTQLDLLAGIEGDGYGTGDLLELAESLQAFEAEDTTSGLLFDILPGVLGEADTIIAAA